ncbi:MAG: hypothetical protein ACO4AI_08300 [Prochlorothrix sp.]
MTPSGRYQSRLFNFVDRQWRDWRDRSAVAWRTVQTTLSWTAQILLYPLYALAQTGRRMRGGTWGDTPHLGASATGVDVADSEISQRSQSVIPTGSIAWGASAIPLAQVRGIACDRQSRNLILIDCQNQSLALNPELRSQRLQRVVLSVSTWSYGHQPQALPWVLRGVVRVSDRRQWYGIGQWLEGWVDWMATRDVAIAAHLFQERADRSPLPPPPLPDRPWATALDALDPQARPLRPIASHPLLGASLRPSLQSIARGALQPVDFFDRRWATWESRLNQSSALVPLTQGWQRFQDTLAQDTLLNSVLRPALQPVLKPTQRWLDRYFFGHWIPPFPGWDPPGSLVVPSEATPELWNSRTAEAGEPLQPPPPTLSPGAQDWLDTFFDQVEVSRPHPSVQSLQSIQPVQPAQPIRFDQPTALATATPPVTLAHGVQSVPPAPVPVSASPVPQDSGPTSSAMSPQANDSQPNSSQPNSSQPNSSQPNDLPLNNAPPDSPSSTEPWHSWPAPPPDRDQSPSAAPRQTAFDAIDRQFEPVSIELSSIDSSRADSSRTDSSRTQSSRIESSPIETSHFDEDPWIETPAVPVGYEQHPLERVLHWLDRVLAWVETKVQRWLQRLLR